MTPRIDESYRLLKRERKGAKGDVSGVLVYHDTICTFRRKNGELFKEMFVKMRRMLNLVGEKCLPEAGWLHNYGY